MVVVIDNERAWNTSPAARFAALIVVSDPAIVGLRSARRSATYQRLDITTKRTLIVNRCDRSEP
jgi:hypothetical protein